MAGWPFLHPCDARGDDSVAAAITGGVISLPVIYSFADVGTEDVFYGRNTAAARRVCPHQLWSVAQRKLDQIRRVRRLDELRHPPGNRLEPLQGDRFGQYSIRINRQYRICFRWEDGNAAQVEIADYH